MTIRIAVSLIVHTAFNVTPNLAEWLPELLKQSPGIPLGFSRGMKGEDFGWTQMAAIYPNTR
ncbi:MAG TPA: hypothetical protein VF797_01635 [Noviherbaspirillum sp.]